MPRLPNYGWLFHCEDCEIITSRLTIVKHRRKTKSVPMCLKCRQKFILVLLNQFDKVAIVEETVAEQCVHVSNRL